MTRNASPILLPTRWSRTSIPLAPTRVWEEMLVFNTEAQGWLPCMITEEAENGELWKMKWWDDSQEDRTKSESEFRPFEEASWWYRITGKTLAKRCQHCRNTDGSEGQWRTREEWTPADWNKKRGSTRCMECQDHDGDGERPHHRGPHLKERGRESLPQTVLLCLHHG